MPGGLRLSSLQLYFVCKFNLPPVNHITEHRPFRADSHADYNDTVDNVGHLNRRRRPSQEASEVSANSTALKGHALTVWTRVNYFDTFTVLAGGEETAFVIHT